MSPKSMLDGARLIFGFTLALIFVTAANAQLSEVQVQNSHSFVPKVNTRSRIYTPSAAEARPEEPLKRVPAISELERHAFKLLNERRLENRLTPVAWNEDLAAVARSHSSNMALNKFFSHQDLDGFRVDDRAERMGVNSWRRIGENIAYNRGYEDPVAFAVTRWMESPLHRENLLSKKWSEAGIGIALAEDGKTFYFTQVFMQR